MPKVMSKAAAVGMRSKTKAAVAPASQSPQPPAKTTTPSPSVQLTHDDIARRARAIWQSGKGGSDLENWLQAERELRAGH